jgi:lipopolysaccharide export LptBFGC system permease protein LptF
MGTTTSRDRGSRTAGYLVAGFLGGVAAWVVLSLFTGMAIAGAALLVAWLTGLVWLAKKHQDEPGWERPSSSDRMS